MSDERRFWFVIDKGKLEYIQDNFTNEKITVTELEDLLNEMSDENRQLKDNNKQLRSLLKDAEKEIKTLKKSNQKLMESLVEKDSEN